MVRDDNDDNGSGDDRSLQVDLVAADRSHCCFARPTVGKANRVESHFLNYSFGARFLSSQCGRGLPVWQQLAGVAVTCWCGCNLPVQLWLAGSSTTCRLDIRPTNDPGSAEEVKQRTLAQDWAIWNLP
jgi:hypothetical protein